MQIRSGSALSILMYYWPFILSGMAFIFYYSKISIRKLALLSGVGVLVGYGVSSFLMFPIAMFVMPLASVYLERETVAILTFTVLYAGAASITVFVLWTLGKSLCAHGIPLESQTSLTPIETSMPSLSHADSSVKSRIVVNISERDYLHSLWLHHGITAWRIGVVIIVASLMGVFAHMAANYSIAVSAGGAIGYITWYLVYYFVILRYRCEKLYRQQKSLHIPAEIAWSNESVEFISANGTVGLKWSDYVKHKENDKLFLLYQSDNLFNIVPKSSFISPEQLKDFSSNINWNAQ